MSNLLLCVGLICGSIIWVEIVRDCYHALAHHWQPLYRLHVWHHRVFRPQSVGNERGNLSSGALVQ
jgi:sterol desaturase/sphingolipid hydroxylase (fatty acid hydroxylase superfamily)